MRIRVADITYATMADGPGIRNVLWVQGCAHRCPECHNPQTHSFTEGQSYDVDDLVEILSENGCDLTLSGGDPLYQYMACMELCQKMRARNPDINIWCWTGFTIEELLSKQVYTPFLKQLDVLVDGPYKKELPRGRWTGSNNQRVIRINELGL